VLALAVIRIVIIVISSIRKLSFSLPASVAVDCVNGYGLGLVLVVVVWLWGAQISLHSPLGLILRLIFLGEGNVLCWHWILLSGVVSCG